MSNYGGEDGGPDEVVYPGGCYLQDELVRCALDEVHCQGLSFRSARQILESPPPSGFDDDDDDAGAADRDRCARPHPDFVGMCTSDVDKHHCTGHASGCVVSSKFVPNVPYCSVRYNHFSGRDTHLTLYPSCSVSGRTTCVWSKDDCPGAETEPQITYYPASYADYYNGNSGLPGISSGDDNGESVNVDRLCTCDKVHTGACVKKGAGGSADSDGDWTCAVSADSCDAETDFRDWEQVVLAGKVCRLCPWFDKRDADSAPVGNVWRLNYGNNNNNHGHGGNHGDHEHSHGHGHCHGNSCHDHDHDENSDTCQAGVAVGVAVAGILFAILVVLSVYTVQILGQGGRKHKRGAMKNGSSNNGKAHSKSFDADNNGGAGGDPTGNEAAAVLVIDMDGGCSGGVDETEPKPCENGTMA